MEPQSKEMLPVGNVGRYRMDARARFEGLASDSREVKPGFLFAALPGTKTDGGEYIADVLKDAGHRVLLSLQEEAEDQYEEEFEDLLHFKTLGDAEVSIMRLDELMRKFRAHGEKAAVGRVLEVARLGKRRAEMIARNHKVEPQKREEKLEIASWFRIWLETPDAFFDWLDVRKQSPEFQGKFPLSEDEE